MHTKSRECLLSTGKCDVHDSHFSTLDNHRLNIPQLREGSVALSTKEEKESCSIQRLSNREIENENTQTPPPPFNIQVSNCKNNWTTNDKR